MIRLQNISIKHKLTLVLMITSGAALVLACVIFGIYARGMFRGAIVEQKATLAALVCANGTASLCLDDQESSRTVLAALRTSPHVVAAYLFRLNGAVFGRLSISRGIKLIG